MTEDNKTYNLTTSVFPSDCFRFKNFVKNEKKPSQIVNFSLFSVIFNKLFMDFIILVSDQTYFLPLNEHSFSIGFIFSPLRSAQGRAEYHNSLKILPYMPAIAPSLLRNWNYITNSAAVIS